MMLHFAWLHRVCNRTATCSNSNPCKDPLFGLTFISVSLPSVLGMHGLDTLDEDANMDKENYRDGDTGLAFDIKQNVSSRQVSSAKVLSLSSTAAVLCQL